MGFAHRGHWASKTRWKRDTNEDEGMAVVRFASGVPLTLHMTSLDSNPKRGQMEITGTKGTYIFDQPTWETITHRGKERTPSSRREPTRRIDGRSSTRTSPTTSPGAPSW